MAEFNSGEWQRLQQEAIRRAQEMQQRAHPISEPSGAAEPPNRAAPQGSNGPVPRTHEPEPHRESVPHESGQRTESVPPSPPKQEPAAAPENILDLLLKDSERTLILVLILLLAEEKTDTGLLFALMYLAI